ncbi:MAG: FmdE family protein [Terriglobales bacterium]
MKITHVSGEFESGAVPNYKITRLQNYKMLSLDDYLREAEVAHGHLCAGQVLGVRLAMLGLEKLGIEDPRGKDRKRLITFVEIDRCATDAIAVVTGCRLGKRALKFRDWGKMAATFVDLETRAGAPLKPALGLSESASDHWYKAIRIAAKESSKALARAMHPEIESKNQQQMLAYREIAEDDLFTRQWVKVELPAEEFPGFKGERVVCAECGEGINFRREVLRNARTLCRACAGERYYEVL